ANDCPGRDPQTWSLKASADGENWTEIDSRSEDFSQRFMRKEYELENSTEYQYFQLQITENSGESATQLADWLLFTEESANPPEVEIPVQEATVNVVDRKSTRLNSSQVSMS